MTAKPAAVAMHPLFATSKNTEPLPCAIEAIDVHRKTASGKMPMLAWVSADSVPDELALLEQFGPGEYMLVGRDIGRTMILRRVMLDLGEIETAPPPAAAAAPSSSSNDLLNVLSMQQAETRAALERLEQRHERDLEREAKRADQQMAMLTTFAGAQIANVKEMATAMVSAKGGGGGGLESLKQASDILDDLHANAKAREDFIREQVKEEVGASKGEVLERVAESFLENVAAGAAAKVH